MTEPPSKKIKPGLEFVELIHECYDLKFKAAPKSSEDEERLKVGIERIRETLKQITSSSGISFGITKTSAKISWGKCLGILLEDGPHSLEAIKVLTERLSPGGGLL